MLAPGPGSGSPEVIAQRAYRRRTRTATSASGYAAPSSRPFVAGHCFVNFDLLSAQRGSRSGISAVRGTIALRAALCVTFCVRLRPLCRCQRNEINSILNGALPCTSFLALPTVARLARRGAIARRQQRTEDAGIVDASEDNGTDHYTCFLAICVFFSYANLQRYRSREKEKKQPQYSFNKQSTHSAQRTGQATVDGSNGGRQFSVFLVCFVVVSLFFSFNSSSFVAICI